jgi:hypothetical protein
VALAEGATVGLGRLVLIMVEEAAGPTGMLMLPTGEVPEGTLPEGATPEGATPEGAPVDSVAGPVIEGATPEGAPVDSVAGPVIEGTTTELLSVSVALGAGPVTVIVETELQVVVMMLVPEVIVSVTGQIVVVT